MEIGLWRILGLNVWCSRYLWTFWRYCLWHSRQQNILILLAIIILLNLLLTQQQILYLNHIIISFLIFIKLPICNHKLIRQHYIRRCPLLMMNFYNRRMISISQVLHHAQDACYLFVWFFVMKYWWRALCM